MKNKSKLMTKELTLTFFMIIGFIIGVHGKVYDVTNYGAKGDAKTLDTKSIQKTINVCALNGGGTVYFPAGSYVLGTIKLENNIHLYLDSGATLICTTDITQFPLLTADFVSLRQSFYALIYAEKKNNITISGNGTISGQGDKAPYQIQHSDQDTDIVRPKIIGMVECKNVKIKDITFLNSPNWMQNYLACEDIYIDGITVLNRRSSVNNDGIDIDSCKNVRISNCNIDSEDDCIVLKSTSDKLCENVTITNNVLTSHCNAIKCGTESNGGFRNITISNNVIYDTYLSGIALEIVDGGIMDLVNINNTVMNNVNNPIFIKLGNRARPFNKIMEIPDIGEMKNIQISNLQANNVGEYVENPDIEFSHHNAKPKAAAIFIVGLNEKAISNITLENFYINYKGGGTKEDALVVVPENPTAYPEYSSYGEIRPTYGFFGRNISGLNLKNINITFDKADHRPAYIFDQVNQLFMDNVQGENLGSGQPTIDLRECKDIYIKLNPQTMIKEDIKTNRSSNLIIE